MAVSTLAPLGGPGVGFCGTFPCTASLRCTSLTLCLGPGCGPSVLSLWWGLLGRGSDLLGLQTSGPSSSCPSSCAASASRILLRAWLYPHSAEIGHEPTSQVVRAGLASMTAGNCCDCGQLKPVLSGHQTQCPALSLHGFLMHSQLHPGPRSKVIIAPEGSSWQPGAGLANSNLPSLRSAVLSVLGTMRETGRSPERTHTR